MKGNKDNKDSRLKWFLGATWIRPEEEATGCFAKQIFNLESSFSPKIFPKNFFFFFVFCNQKRTLSNFAFNCLLVIVEVSWRFFKQNAGYFDFLDLFDQFSHRMRHRT